MVINMLKAVAQILDTNLDAVNLKTRVTCGKIMLNEIIKGMETSEVKPSTPPTASTPTPKAPTPPTPPTPPAEYKLEIDPITKTLKRITLNNKPISSNTLLLIDGIEIIYSKAIGLAFKKLQVVDDAE